MHWGAHIGSQLIVCFHCSSYWATALTIWLRDPPIKSTRAKGWMKTCRVTIVVPSNIFQSTVQCCSILQSRHVAGWVWPCSLQLETFDTNPEGSRAFHVPRARFADHSVDVCHLRFLTAACWTVFEANKHFGPWKSCLDQCSLCFGGSHCLPSYNPVVELIGFQHSVC